MVCIYCGNSTQVTNSRLQKRSNQVWRRRRCQTCKSTFTTRESADLSTSLAVTYSATDIRPFSRDTLLMSIYDCCRHRPSAIDDATHLTQTIISCFIKQNNGTISRSAIVETCIDTLKRFDSTAATIYSAYHPLRKNAD